MTAGVYLIRNAVTGRRYVGVSSSVEGRWENHLYALRSGKHHSRLMQADYDAHGAASLEIGMLERYTSSELSSRQYLEWERKQEAEWYQRLRPEYNSRALTTGNAITLRDWKLEDVIKPAEGGTNAGN